MEDQPIYPYIYSRKRYKTSSTIGIEIELEDPQFPSITPRDLNFWIVKRDGSLRGTGGEFILKPPKPIEKAIKSLGILKTWCENNYLSLNFSRRTSVHIHYNMTDRTIQDIYKVLIVYYLLEEILVKWSSNSYREDSNFCLKLSHADNTLVKLLSINSHQQFKSLTNSNTRYSALNLASLNYFGSLEFRSMEGNMDVPRISTWIRQIDKLISLACEFETKESIIDFFDRTSPIDFIEYFLIPSIFSWAQKLDNVEDLLYQNHSYCFLLAYHSTKFTAPKEIKEKKNIAISANIVGIEQLRTEMVISERELDDIDVIDDDADDVSLVVPRPRQTPRGIGQYSTITQQNIASDRLQRETEYLSPDEHASPAEVRERLADFNTSNTYTEDEDTEA